MMKVGLLSVENFPLLPTIISDLKEIEIESLCVILDQKLLSDKNLKIFKERTDNFFSKKKIDSNFPIYKVPSHNSQQCSDLVSELKLDYLINAGTPRILKKCLLESPKKGVINCHPGKLPSYRGCTCVEWAIYNDDPIYCTTHLMTEGIDEGDIILDKEVKSYRGETYNDIRVNVYKQTSKLIAETLEYLNSSTSPKLIKQTHGTYYDVIPEDKMKVALKKIEEKTYLHLN